MEGGAVSGPDDHYEVTIVKYGTRSTTRSDVYLNFPLYHESEGPIEMDYFFLDRAEPAAHCRGRHGFLSRRWQGTQPDLVG